jgi:TPR repeat protein
MSDDPKRGVIKELAELGVADAQYNLAWRYYIGQGVPQDYVAAAKWCLMAAGAGHAAAQFSLESGAFRGQDDNEAAKWFGLALQGDAEAQFNLGLLYVKGEGVPQDYVDAAEWYRRAAEQGHAGAQFATGINTSSLNIRLEYSRSGKSNFMVDIWLS